ncbi:MAG: flagellar hook basal-body protein [Bryobacteraceae bacterium]
MDRLLTAAASGMAARMSTLDLLANNLANAGATGYKSDREAYSTYLSPETAVGDDMARLPVVDHRWTDFSQGLLQSTGNQSDLALSGDGFFAVDGPSGPLYTRNGKFTVSPKGILETADGYAVATASGRPLKLDLALPFNVGADGVVRQSGAEIDRLKVVRFTTPESLTKRNGTYFQWLSPQAMPALSSGAQVLQGQLESANAITAQGAVRIVSVLREFEMLQKALTMGGEMNRRAIEDVAKV